MAQNVTLQFGEKRNAEFVNRHFEDVIPPGIYKGFNARETVAPSLFLDIKAEADGTNVVVTDEGIRIEEDADLLGAVSIPVPDPSLPRIDSIFVKHKFVPTNDPATIELIAGVPDVTPAPTPPPADGFFRVQLATVLVPAAASSIVDADITNDAKTALSVAAQPLNALTDVSNDLANSVIGSVGRGFNDPSAVNVMATIGDTNAKFLKPVPRSPADSFVTILGGESWDNRLINTTSVVDTNVQLTLLPTANPRFDLIAFNQETQAFSIINGAEDASPVIPALTNPSLVPVAAILVDEIGGPIIVTETDITDVRPPPHVKTPELFDLPDLTTDIKDAITGAAAPDASNVFQTEADVDTAVDPLGQAFAHDRVRLETGIVVNDQTRLDGGAVVTCHNAGFTVLKTIFTPGDLIADGGGGVGPGGLDASTAFNATDWYHIYLIAKSASAGPAFDAALLISDSQTSPDLTDASLSGAGFDIFRRLSAVRTDATPIFLLSFMENGRTFYVDGQVFSSTLGSVGTSFAAAPNPLSFSTRVPPTSRRAQFIVGDITSPSASTLFVTHGSDTRTTSGGRTVSQDVGTGGSQINTFEADLDASQRARFRVSAGAIGASPQFELGGYYENP